MVKNVISQLPESYKNPVSAEFQGTAAEVTYSVCNYIDPQRQLVTNQKISAEEAGRKTVEGNAITKRCFVYLPKGYDKNNPVNRYDTLYLLHGVGGNCYEWLCSGSDKWDPDRSDNHVLCNIFDNMIANGDIEPMIVVLPEGRSAHDWTDCSFNTNGTHLLGFYYFDYELRYDLIPFIESEFNTRANIRDTSPEGIAYNRMHRAIGGLSMGGMQVLNLVLGGHRCDSTLYTGKSSGWGNGLDAVVRVPGMTDLFAYAGTFSNAPTSSDGRILGESVVSGGHKLQLLYMSCGDMDEIAYKIGYMKAVNGLGEAAGSCLGDFYRVIEKDGVHDFTVWNNGVYNFARLSFRERESQAWPNCIDHIV